MSSTNKTTNLELSQFIGSDKPQWLVDYNGDMSKIDTGVAAVKAQADATDLTVASHTSSIATLSQASSDQASAITALRTDVDGNTGNINTINSLIGNGEPTTTDKTIIGAINEIYADIGGGDGVEADDVTYDNTSSGLTATNVQAAIDELAQGGSATVEADDVTYDNTSSGLTATDVQAAIDEVAASAAAAWTKIGEVSKSGQTGDTETFTVTDDISGAKEILVRLLDSNEVVATSIGFLTDTKITAVFCRTTSSGSINRETFAYFDPTTKVLTVDIHYATSVSVKAEVYIR